MTAIDSAPETTPAPLVLVPPAPAVRLLPNTLPPEVAMLLEECPRTKGKVFAALCAAQAEYPTIIKGDTADTGKFKYDYADLADVLKQITPVNSRHGLALFHVSHGRGPTFGVTTILAHTSGEYLCLTMYPPGVPSDIHQQGSALTYLRRYSGLTICGVAPANEDDDGNAAKGQPATMQPRGTAQRPQAQTGRPANGNAQPGARPQAAPQAPPAQAKPTPAAPPPPAPKVDALALAQQQIAALQAQTPPAAPPADDRGPEGEIPPHDPETGEVTEPPVPPSASMCTALNKLMGEAGLRTREQRLGWVSAQVRRPTSAFTQTTTREAKEMLETLEACQEANHLIGVVELADPVGWVSKTVGREITMLTDLTAREAREVRDGLKLVAEPGK